MENRNRLRFRNVILITIILSISVALIIVHFSSKPTQLLDHAKRVSKLQERGNFGWASNHQLWISQNFRYSLFDVNQNKETDCFSLPDDLKNAQDLQLPLYSSVAKKSLWVSGKWIRKHIETFRVSCLDLSGKPLFSSHLGSYYDGALLRPNPICWCKDGLGWLEFSAAKIKYRAPFTVIFKHFVNNPKTIQTIALPATHPIHSGDDVFAFQDDKIWVDCSSNLDTHPGIDEYLLKNGHLEWIKFHPITPPTSVEETRSAFSKNVGSVAWSVTKKIPDSIIAYYIIKLMHWPKQPIRYVTQIFITNLITDKSREIGSMTGDYVSIDIQSLNCSPDARSICFSLKNEIYIVSVN